jgi:transcriptional regulator with GAF, ATPase, and Fis domain
MTERHRHCESHGLLREIATSLSVALPGSTDAVIDDGLKRIGSLFGVDRVLIAPIAESGVIGAPIRIWVSRDWTDRKLGQDVALPSMPNATAHLARSRALIFGRVDDLPDWPEEREALRRLGIGASAVVVLGSAGSHLIAMALDSLRPEVDWPEDIVHDLRVIGGLILSALQHGEIEDEVEGLRGFTEIIAGIAARLVNLFPERVDEEVESALGRVCRFLDVDLGTMSQWTDPSRSSLMIGHEWAREATGGPFFRGTVIRAEYAWLSNRLKDRSPLAISSLDDFPPEARVERATCERMGIQSMLWVPYEVESTIGGHIVLNTIHRRRIWSDRTVPQLRLLGQVLAGAVAHKHADVALNHALREIRSLKDRIEVENLSLRQEVRQSSEHDDLVGRSPALQDVLHKVDQVAPTDSAVLLLGETGTGKGLIAHAIHAGSRRAKRPLITVNCAALPALLIESELFGHEKGAFTGAVARKIGRFEMADGGTLFLDEIGDLPQDLQAKLLRVLHDRQFERLGSSETMTVDVRIIAATNRHLEELVERGSFRADLYHRLHVFPIHMPPLRKYREDIPLLSWYFVQKLRGRLGRQIESVSPEAMERLKAYHWPGNVRELQNVLERAIILSSGSTLDARDIYLADEREVHHPTPGRTPREKTLQDAEHDYILRALKECEWKVRGKDGAAERLGLKRTTLNSRMKKLGIQRPA